MNHDDEFIDDGRITFKFSLSNKYDGYFKYKYDDGEYYHEKWQNLPFANRIWIGPGGIPYTYNKANIPEPLKGSEVSQYIHKIFSLKLKDENLKKVAEGEKKAKEAQSKRIEEQKNNPPEEKPKDKEIREKLIIDDVEFSFIKNVMNSGKATYKNNSEDLVGIFNIDNNELMWKSKEGNKEIKYRDAPQFKSIIDKLKENKPKEIISTKFSIQIDDILYERKLEDGNVSATYKGTIPVVNEKIKNNLPGIFYVINNELKWKSSTDSIELFVKDTSFHHTYREMFAIDTSKKEGGKEKGGEVPYDPNKGKQDDNKKEGGKEKGGEVPYDPNKGKKEEGKEKDDNKGRQSKFSPIIRAPSFVTRFAPILLGAGILACYSVYNYKIKLDEREHQKEMLRIKKEFVDDLEPEKPESEETSTTFKKPESQPSSTYKKSESQPSSTYKKPESQPSGVSLLDSALKIKQLFSASESDKQREFELKKANLSALSDEKKELIKRDIEKDKSLTEKEKLMINRELQLKEIEIKGLSEKNKLAIQESIEKNKLLDAREARELNLKIAEGKNLTEKELAEIKASIEEDKYLAQNEKNKLKYELESETKKYVAEQKAQSGIKKEELKKEAIEKKIESKEKIALKPLEFKMELIKDQQIRETLEKNKKEINEHKEKIKKKNIELRKLEDDYNKNLDEKNNLMDKIEKVKEAAKKNSEHIKNNINLISNYDDKVTILNYEIELDNIVKNDFDKWKNLTDIQNILNKYEDFDEGLEYTAKALNKKMMQLKKDYINKEQEINRILEMRLKEIDDFKKEIEADTLQLEKLEKDNNELYEAHKIK